MSATCRELLSGCGVYAHPRYPDAIISRQMNSRQAGQVICNKRPVDFETAPKILIVPYWEGTQNLKPAKFFWGYCGGETQE